jgi:hypothetical protein
MDTIIDTIMKLKANAGMLKEQPLISNIARTEMLRLIDVLKQQVESVKVIRATRSPMNKMQWSVDLECGHTIWVTSKKEPQIAKCDVCSSNR